MCRTDGEAQLRQFKDGGNLNQQTKHHRHRIGERILRASTLVAIAHLCLKFVGLVQVMVLGRYVERGILDVVYVGVFEGCIFTFFLFGEELIGPTFLPVFMREMDDHGEAAAWKFANVLISLQVLVLLAVVLALMLFPGLFVGLVTDWGPERSPERFSLARDSLVSLAPALICLSLGSTTYMILNGYKRFFLAAFGDASWKLLALISVVVGIWLFDFGFEGLIFGLVLGSFAKLGTHLLGLLAPLRHLHWSLNWRSRPLRAMALLMLPLLAGIVFAKFRDVFNNQYILSRLDTDGLMTANSFGRKLYMAIGWLVPYAMSIAMFPFFCEMVDRDDQEHLGEVLTHSGRLLLAVFVPFSMVCLVLARPLTSLLFQGGHFDAEMVSWTSWSMAVYTLVLPAFALEYLLMQAFFAHRRTVAVTVIGISTSLVSVLVSYVGIRLLGATGLAALLAIAGGFVVSRGLKTAVLIVMLRRTVPLFPASETLATLGRTVLAGGLATGLALACDWGFVHYLSAGVGKLPMLLRLVATTGAGGAGFVVGVVLFRLREPLEMLQWARQRLAGRATAGAVDGAPGR